MMVIVEDPETYEEAMRASKRNELRLDLNEELDSIERNNTWVKAVLPRGKDAIQCRVVIKRKLNGQERFAWYKAHLFTKGYFQKDGVNYDETFAPGIPFDVLLLIVGTFIMMTFILLS